MIESHHHENNILIFDQLSFSINFVNDNYNNSKDKLYYKNRRLKRYPKI